VNALLCASLDGPQALRWQAHELPPPDATENSAPLTQSDDRDDADIVPFPNPGLGLPRKG